MHSDVNGNTRLKKLNKIKENRFPVQLWPPSPSISVIKKLAMSQQLQGEQFKCQLSPFVSEHVIKKSISKKELFGFVSLELNQYGK